MTVLRVFMALFGTALRAPFGLTGAATTAGANGCAGRLALMVVLGSHMDDVRKFPCAAKKAAKVFFAAGGMFLVVSTWDQIRKKTGSKVTGYDIL